MGDGSLSQDEINALLMGAADNQFQETSFSTQVLQAVEDTFMPLATHIEAILKKMVDKNFTVLAQPAVINNKADFLNQFNEKVVDAFTSFTNTETFSHHFILDTNQANQLTQELTGQEEKSSSTAISTTAISEFLSSLTETIAQILTVKLNQRISSSPVNVQIIETGMTRLPSDDFIVIPFEITLAEHKITLYAILDPQLAHIIFDSNEIIVTSAGKERLNINPNNHSVSALNTQQEITTYTSLTQPTPIVQGISLPNLVNGSAPQETKNIGLLMDVMMEVTVELGRTRQPIKDILSIGEGTIIELDKLAGEPVDILVNHNRIAKGEVVVIDENFGVRITEILSSSDKINER